MSCNGNVDLDLHIQEKYWKAIKLAVAVACIRVKPCELTGKEFVMQLQFRFWENLIKQSAKPSAEQCFISDDITTCKATKSIYVKISSKLHNLLLNCYGRFIAIRPFINSQESKTPFEISLIKSRLFDVCMSLIKTIKHVACQNSQSSQLLCCRDLLFFSVVGLCEGIEFFEASIETAALVVNVSSSYISQLVDESIELTSLLCISLMEASQAKRKKLFFLLLNKLSECKILKINIAKQLLYWIEWVKEQLILVINGKLSWNLKTFKYFNNVSYVLRLMESILSSLFQYNEHNSKSSKQFRSEDCFMEKSKFFYLDYNFFVTAQKQLENNIQICLSSYPIFANYLLRLGYILSEILKNQ